jgi:hypothetical protein
MRIRTITGLALAGAAAATAVALGGAAYAEGGGDTSRFTPAVTTGDSSRTVTTGTDADGAAAEWDCPEKDGSAGSAPAEAQPESAAESLWSAIRQGTPGPVTGPGVPTIAERVCDLIDVIYAQLPGIVAHRRGLDPATGSGGD